MALVPRVFLTADQIQKRVREMGDQISTDFPQGPIYLIAILKGAFMFLADLSRAIRTPSRVEFIGISSYGRGKTIRASEGHQGSGCFHRRSSRSDRGRYRRQRRDPDVPDECAHSAASEIAEHRHLVGQTRATLAAGEVAYVGFKIPDEFVVGYGLDFAEDYRNLADICILSEQ